MSSESETYSLRYGEQVDDTDVSDHEELPPRKRRGESKKYEKYSTFESLDLAQANLKEENSSWSIIRRNNTSEGFKICYQCKVNCPKSAYILCHNNE